MRIVQITDLHLTADPAYLMHGVLTAETGARVIGAVASLDPAPDLVVATGDLTQDGEEGSYRHLRSATAPLPCPVRCAPGNHDARRAFRAGFLGETSPDDDFLDLAIDHGGLRLILLDTLVPGHEGGRLEPEQIAWLRAEVEAGAGRPRLVFLHHHPLEISSPWMDRMMLSNADEMFEALAPARPDLLGIFFGHVHQDFEGEWEGVPVRGTRSTCLQFTPRADRFIPYDAAPAYRIIDVDPAARRLETRVVDVPG